MTRSKDQISEELIAKAKQFAKKASPQLCGGVTTYDYSTPQMRVVLTTSEAGGNADKQFCMVIDSRKDGEQKIVKLVRRAGKPDQWTGCHKDCSSIIEHAFASSPTVPLRKSRVCASDAPKAP